MGTQNVLTPGHHICMTWSDMYMHVSIFALLWGYMHVSVFVWLWGIGVTCMSVLHLYAYSK